MPALGPVIPGSGMYRPVRAQPLHVIEHPVPQRLVVAARVHAAELGIRALVLPDPVERHEPDVRRAHDALAEVVDAVI